MGAYDNPQRIVNNSFNALIQSGKQLTNNIATTAQQISNNVKAQKKQLEEKQAALDIEQQSMYSKVNELPSTTNEKLDNNIHSFWNEQVDEYFRIKNEMDAGTYEGGRAAGNKALAEINGRVGQFQTQAKYLGEQCAGYSKALSNDELSSTGSMINKNFLQAMCDGGDVRTVIKDGQLVYQLGDSDEFLNGTQLISNAAGEEDLFNTKTDYTKPLQNIFNKTAQPNEAESNYFETIQVKKGDPIPGQPGEFFNNLDEGFMYTMQYITPEKKDAYLKDAFNSPMMTPLITNEKAMLSEWQDNIPDGYANGKATGEENSIAGIAAQLGIDDAALGDLGMTMDDLVNSSWHEYPTGFSEDQQKKLDDIQNKIAKTYLARESYQNNGLQVGSIKTKDRVKIEAPDNSGSGSGSGSGTSKLANQFGINYGAKQVEDFENNLEKEDLFKSTIRTIGNYPSQTEITNYIQENFPKLLSNDGKTLDPSYGKIDSKQKLINSINDAYGFKSGHYINMKKQADKYKSQTGGGGGASKFNP
tara:strand:- start:8966 stop:10555 length:1590 start_codon:yes stop_codon:yes gene_type:complete